jgi:hypothetical protein
MLMKYYATPSSVGVPETFVTTGTVYFLIMMFGVFMIRLPADGWRPEGFVPRTVAGDRITIGNVSVDTAFTTE